METSSAGSLTDFAAMRYPYLAGGLAEEDLAGDWLTQFARWLADAVAAAAPEPNAMVLSTASADGAPSARIVLLKGVDAGGFDFFTNYESRKGQDLSGNPRACLVFPWIVLQRQVIVTGSVERIARAESAEYFRSRPRGSRLGAWASHQSAVADSRQALEDARAEVESRFGGEETDGEVPLPDFWGGYRVVPQMVEFWQGRQDRMHDRLRFRDDGGGTWTVERLCP